MFRHDRVYRAIALSGPDFDDLGSVRALLPPKCLSVVEPAVADEHLRAEHYYYYSRTAFTRNIDVLQKARAKWNGVEQYRYNIYFVGIRYRRQFVAFVAVPSGKWLARCTRIFEQQRGDVALCFGKWRWSRFSEPRRRPRSWRPS